MLQLNGDLNLENNLFKKVLRKNRGKSPLGFWVGVYLIFIGSVSVGSSAVSVPSHPCIKDFNTYKLFRFLGGGGYSYYSVVSDIDSLLIYVAIQAPEPYEASGKIQLCIKDFSGRLLYINSRVANCKVFRNTREARIFMLDELLRRKVIK